MSNAAVIAKVIRESPEDLIDLLEEGFASSYDPIAYPNVGNAHAALIEAIRGWPSEGWVTDGTCPLYDALGSYQQGLLSTRQCKLIQAAAKQLIPLNRAAGVAIGRAAYQYRLAFRPEPEEFTYTYTNVPSEEPADEVPWNESIEYGYEPEPKPDPEITAEQRHAILTAHTWSIPKGYRYWDIVQQKLWSISDWPYPVTQRDLFDSFIRHWYDKRYSTRFIKLFKRIVWRLQTQPELFPSLFHQLLTTYSRPNSVRILGLANFIITHAL
jgi:hypothetical protein